MRRGRRTDVGGAGAAEGRARACLESPATRAMSARRIEAKGSLSMSLSRLSAHACRAPAIACALALAVAACDARSPSQAEPVAAPAAAPASAPAAPATGPGTGPASAPASAPAPTSELAAQPLPAGEHGVLAHEVPAGFSSYASQALAGNRRCVAGAVTDEDGMNQRPVVYVEHSSGKPIWVRTLALPEGMHAGRITHCLARGDAVYALMQYDTQAAQSLSQTLLRVVRLASADGAVRGAADVQVPGATGAYSVLLGEGERAVRWDGDALSLSGQYFTLDAPDQRRDFQLSLPAGASR